MKIPRHVPLIFGSLFLCLSAGGCASGRLGKRFSSHASKRGAGADAARQDKPLPPGGAWRQSIGRVILVNEPMGFVLIDTGTAAAPASGTPLQSYLQSEPTAQLSVSVYQRRPYLIADVVGGAPRVGDSVTLMASRTGVSAGAAKTGLDGAGAGALPGRGELSGGVVAPVKIFDRERAPTSFLGESQTLRSTVMEEPGASSAEKNDPVVPAPSPAPAPEIEAAPDGGASAIPGLPLRRGRAAGP